jgi:hypothetical protein
MPLRRLAFLALALALVACATAPSKPAPTDRLHPEFGERIRPVRVVGVLPPKVSVYEIAAGGTRELKDAWSEAARENVARALASGLASRKLEVKVLEPTPDTGAELEEVRLLYEQVAPSIVFATYGDRFPEKRWSFDYSVGDVSALLDRTGVDALALVYGFDEISSGGRKTTQAVTAVALAALGVVASPQGGMTMLYAALVDRTGTVIWFDVRGARGSFDLRDPQSAGALVGRVLLDLPPAAP